jgi:small subunit ribosomal protein S10
MNSLRNGEARLSKHNIFIASFFNTMMARTRIKLTSININKLNEIVNSIKDISGKSGIIIKGPVPLPTKRLKVTTRKSPCGNGKATFDRFEMRIHKRVIDMPSDERVLHSVMRLPIPKEVNVEIEMIE